MMEATLADDHKDALEAYEVCARAAEDNNRTYLEDYRFSLLDEQWDDSVKAARSVPGQERPMLTFNQLPAFGHQVVNEIRQNRPTTKFRPVDSAADPETALVMQGLVRNIHYLSRADVAHDTGAHCAVHGGFGFWRIDIDYACDTSFDQEIRIKRIPNPLSVLQDPYSVEADSLDWDMAFVQELMTEAAFKEAYPKADPVSFGGADNHVKRDWDKGSDILVAEYWKRSKEAKTILLMSNGQVVYEDDYLAPNPEGGPTDKDIFDAQGITVARSRQIMAHVVDQCILNGQETLTDKVRWAGKYIPIIPVYGEELNLEGKRILKSMINRAKDAQRQINYWETTATELVALTPRVPFIGPKGAFDTDPNWNTANSQNHPYLEYDGLTAPARHPMDTGPAVGAMQEALRATDRMKAILGMYGASLGERTNETSGKAIDSRKQEGDVGNYHFSDNVNRAIECEGKQLADLIARVYTKGRIVNILGEDGTEQQIQLGQRQRVERPMQPGQQPEPPKIGALEGIFDLGMGTYDVYVEAGPSYTTQRQETAAVIGEMGRGNPAIWQIGGDIMVRNLDLKDGDELARRLKKMLPPQLQDQGEQQIPPAVQQQMAQMEEQLGLLSEENQKLKQGEAAKAADVLKQQVTMRQLDIEEKKIPAESMEQQIKLLTAQKQLFEAQANLEKTRAEIVAAKQQTETEIANGTNEQVNNAVPALMQAIENVRAEATRPRVKRGRAKKMPNGEFELVSVEEMRPQGVM
jgi:hypothetical protein